MKRSRFTEEQINRGPAGAGGRDEGVGAVPQARHLLADILRLEGEVRRDERLGCQATEAAGGQECPAEEAAGGDDAEQCGAEGDIVPPACGLLPRFAGRPSASSDCAGALDCPRAIVGVRYR
jgi:hypothetical protein